MFTLAEDLLAAGGLAVWVWLASLGPVLLTSAVSILGSWSRGTAALRCAISAAPVVMFSISLGSAGGIIAGARRATIAYGLALASSPWPEPWRMVALQLDLALFGACLLALLAPVVALAAAKPWMAAGRRGVVALVAAAVAGVLLVALASVVVATLDVVHALRDAAGMDAASKHDAIYAALDVATHALAVARGPVVALGALLAIVGAIAGARAAQRGHRAGALSGVAAALMLSCGVAAHALSRPLVADAESPPTLPRRLDAFFRVPNHLPRAERCLRSPWEVAPVVIFDRDVRLDGRAMTATASLEADLGTLRRNFGILHPGEPWPALLHVWAPASLPARTLSPWLAAASRADVRRVHLAVVTGAELRTRSLGVVEYSTHCVLPIALDRSPDAVPLSSLRDVDELARRAADGSLCVDAR